MPRIALWILLPLHLAGLVVYALRRILVEPALWDNPLYAVGLGAHYYHLHTIAFLGHLYLWGLYLLRKRFDSPWFVSYWASVVAAGLLTVLPLLGVVRSREVLGAATYAALVGYNLVFAIAFVALFVTHLRGRLQRRMATAFHVYCGYQVTCLSLRYALVDTPTANAVFHWGMLALHGALIAWILKRGSAQVHATGASWRVRAVNLTAVALLAALCLPHRAIADWLVG